MLDAEIPDKTSQVIRTHLPNVHLSSLVNHEIKNGHSSEQPPIYQDWSLPSLRILHRESCTWLPPPSFASRAPNLIACTLMSMTVDFPKLISFLNAIPRLEQIILKVCKDKDDDNVALVQSMKLQFPKLWSLELICSSYGDNCNFLDRNLPVNHTPHYFQHG